MPKKSINQPTILSIVVLNSLAYSFSRKISSYFFGSLLTYSTVSLIIELKQASINFAQGKHEQSKQTVSDSTSLLASVNFLGFHFLIVYFGTFMIVSLNSC